MSVRNDAAAAAARRAAEEARRRAEEARRRAQEAAKKAAQEAAKKAAQAAAKKAAQAAQAANAKKLSQSAGQRPAASAVRQAFGKDEMSQGLGRSLRARAASALGGAPALSPSVIPARTASAPATAGLSPAGAQLDGARTTRRGPPPGGVQLERLDGPRTPAASHRGPPPGGVQLERLDGPRSPATSHRGPPPGGVQADRLDTPRGPTAQEVYDRELRETVQKPLSEWTRDDAADFTSALADQVEAHRDDPEFVRGLMTVSSERLRTVARLTGEATQEKGDRDETERMTRELSRLGNALPEDMATRLAAGIASEIPERSEQEYVDDGFDQFIQDGGDDTFRELIAGALVSQGKEDAAEELLEHEGGSSLTDRLGDLRDRFGDLLDGAGNLASDAWDFGGDALQVAGQGIEAVGGVIDGVTDALVPPELQSVLGRGPLGPLLHAGQTLEDIGQTIQDLPEFVDAIRQAASYRGQISELGVGDSFTMGASGDLSISGITGTLEGEISISRGEDGFTVTVGGELGVGVGGPLEPGLEGSVTATAGGAVEYTFDSAEDAKRGVDIIMANAIGRSGLIGQAADAVGITERIFGASNDDLDELSQSQSAVTLSAGAAAELSAALQGTPISGQFEGDVEHSVRIEYEHGDISEVVLQTQLSAGASGTIGANGSNVNGGLSGSVSVSQGFDVPEGTSLAELLTHPQELERQRDAELTFNAEVRGGSRAQVGNEDNHAALTENEGVQASATVRGDPAELLRSGALEAIVTGDFQGALDALASVQGLQIEAEVRSFETDGVSAQAGGGSGGNGGHVDVSAETRDFAEEPLAEFSGDLDDVRRELSRLQAQVVQGAVDASALRFLEPIIGAV